MNELAAYLQARLEELTAGQTFHRRRDGTLISPTVARTNPPAPKSDYEEGDNYPLVRWAVYGGKIDGGLHERLVVINLGIWTPGSVAQGTDDIERLTEAVLGIAGDPGIAGHRLSPVVEYEIGDQGEHSEGLQPHPYYQAAIKLRFTAPRRRITCTT